MAIPTYDEYVATLSRLTEHVDPTTSTPEAAAIKMAADSLAVLDSLDKIALERWTRENPQAVPVLGLTVGLSQEKLKNALKQHMGTTGWVTAARERPGEIVAMLDSQFGLVESLKAQISRTYSFGDVLVARAGARVTAVSASASGRVLEDQIEAIAVELGLTYETRTRFEGRFGRTAPCDLAIPAGGAAAQVVVAAKAFDSTGSKLTDAVREVEEMAEVRKGSQTVMAAIDGVGWLSRANDLRRIYTLWANGEIDGMYTVSTLDRFKADLQDAARFKKLI
ncbi:hypothetical protein [Trebonia sp.]|uniref:hypothetical protein n=1 Tax=Trebonia sp. TaxID=2767075 RepID=UPI0026095C8A|nr:hypothetical protein [Trebonia sp.]